MHVHDAPAVLVTAVDLGDPSLSHEFHTGLASAADAFQVHGVSVRVSHLLDEQVEPLVPRISIGLGHAGEPVPHRRPPQRGSSEGPEERDLRRVHPELLEGHGISGNQLAQCHSLVHLELRPFRTRTDRGRHAATANPARARYTAQDPIRTISAARGEDCTRLVSPPAPSA